jgi:hypothetical protein
MTRIMSLDATNTGHIQFTTDDGESVSAPVIASDGGYSIINHDAGEKWVAIQVVDYGDGDAEVYECREGDTFDDGIDMHAYIVRRTDNAGSLKWVEN